MRSILTVSQRGTVTLPAGLRRALGLRPDDRLVAETTPEGLLLRPAVTLPIEIYDERRVREFEVAEAEVGAALAGRVKSPSRKRPRGSRSRRE